MPVLSGGPDPRGGGSSHIPARRLLSGATAGPRVPVIAAAARIDSAVILTRNTRDFTLTPVRLLTY